MDQILEDVENLNETQEDPENVNQSVLKILQEANYTKVDWNSKKGEKILFDFEAALDMSLEEDSEREKIEQDTESLFVENAVSGEELKNDRRLVKYFDELTGQNSIKGKGKKTRSSTAAASDTDDSDDEEDVLYKNPETCKLKFTGKNVSKILKIFFYHRLP